MKRIKAFDGVHHGMNMRDALRAAEAVGIRLRYHAGEVTLYHRCMRRQTTATVHRKDAPRELTSYLLRFMRMNSPAA